MKKTLLLTSVIALGALSSMAQGVINANNAGTGVAILIQDTTGQIDGGAAVKIGTPATAAGFIGAGPAQVAMALYADPDSVAHGSLATLLATTPIWTGFNVPSGLASQQGNVAPNSSFVLPTQTGLDGSVPVDFVFTSSVTVLGRVFSGDSGIGVIQPTTAAAFASGTGGAAIWGTAAGDISSFTFTTTPEPGTIALGGLGAAALLLFRRRK